MRDAYKLATHYASHITFLMVETTQEIHKRVEVAHLMEDFTEMTLNMGPQHPSTHGVLRVILKLDGETVTDLDCDIGYLHRGVEKICENRNYPMITPYWDRTDYVAAMAGTLCYV